MAELNGGSGSGREPVRLGVYTAGATRHGAYGRGHDVPDTSVSRPRSPTMLAIAAAVLFLIALIFELIGFSISVITPTVLLTAGALCVALHLAGVGHRPLA